MYTIIEILIGIGAGLMNKEDVKELICIIDGTYPNFLNGRDLKTVFNAWYRFFQGKDKKKVFRKLDEWIANNSYPPTPNNLNVADWSVYE